MSGGVENFYTCCMLPNSFCGAMNVTECVGYREKTFLSLLTSKQSGRFFPVFCSRYF